VLIIRWMLLASIFEGAMWASAQTMPATTAPELPGLDQVVTAFEATDKACNDGKGLSESADSGSLGWGESRWLRNYWEMYELTGQTRWWDKMIEHFGRMLANMTDHDNDGYLSWQTRTYSVALIRAELLHNRGTTTCEVARSRIPLNKDARQVTGHRYLIEFNKDTTFSIRDATTGKTLATNQHYQSGKAITVEPHVQVKLTGQPCPGDTFCIWTTAPQLVEYVVHQGMVLTPMARFIEVALKRPPDDRYHAKAREFLSVIEKHFLEGNEKYWIDSENGAGAYRFTKDPTERFPNRILPHNQYLALAHTWLILADATGKELYRRRATAMAKNFKHALRIVENAYEWNYWDWIENGKPDHSGIEDTSHGSIDVGFLVEAARRHVVFDDEDARRLTRTLLRRMWNGSTTDPRFGRNVNTTQGDAVPIRSWIELGQWDPAAFNIIARSVMTHRSEEDRATAMPTVLAARKRIQNPPTTRAL